MDHKKQGLSSCSMKTFEKRPENVNELCIICPDRHTCEILVKYLMFNSQYMDMVILIYIMSSDQG